MSPATTAVADILANRFAFMGSDFHSFRLLAFLTLLSAS
jgi:hypothetical protein